MPKLGLQLLFVVTLFTSVAHADKEQAFTAGAYSDTYHTSLSTFSVDDQGTPNPSKVFGAFRLGADASYTKGAFGIALAGDVVAFRAYGDRSNLGLSLGMDTFREPISAGADFLWLPRTAALQYRSSIGLIRCGQQTAHWGLGLLINDGKQRNRFGAALNANTSMRCLFATKPFTAVPKLSVVLTGDAVYRDENAEWRLGDRAYGGSIGVRYDADEQQLGILTSIRRQRDRRDPRHPKGSRTQLDVMVFDLFWKQEMHLGTLPMEWVGEVATIIGDTNRPYLDETFEHGADVQSVGGATAVSAMVGQHQLRFEMGYASGDNDPTDETIRTFNFHSSYGMGLIFVDHVLPALSARAVDRIDDRELIDVTPPSLRFLVSQGGLQSTTYLSPTVTVSLPWRLHLNTTYFYFAGGPDLVDIYNSNLNGGFNTTYGARPATGAPIGHEVNIRLGYDLSFAKSRRVRFNAEGGTFIPGASMRGIIEDPIHVLQFTTHIQL